MTTSTIIQLSGSFSVMINFLALGWMVMKYRYYHSMVIGLAIAMSIYITIHLYLHTIAPTNLSIMHILLDDGVITLAAIVNVLRFNDDAN